jgi:hypothetical protein
MKKFLVSYHAPVPLLEQIAHATPEESQASMQAWMAWTKKAGSAVVDLGVPLGNSKKIGIAGNADATVVGYSVVQADSINSAAKLFDGHPHLKINGCSIEIFEQVPTGEV